MHYNSIITIQTNEGTNFIKIKILQHTSSLKVSGFTDPSSGSAHLYKTVA